MTEWLAQRTPWEILASISTIGMLIGTLVRLATLKTESSTKHASRLGSLKTWWVLLLLLLAASAIGPWGIIVLLAVGGSLALDEYLKISMPDLSTTARRAWIALVVVANYAWLGFVPQLDYRACIPLLIVWSLVVPHLLSDSPKHYLDHVGHALWGSLVVVWGVSHAAFLVARDEPAGDLPTRIGWFLVLVFLTEFNDIAQALIGRAIGKHRILPTVSPNKTWEGFLGGMGATISLAFLLQWLLQLRPLRTLEIDQPYSLTAMLGLGAVIALSGFVGDLNMSCVKRDVGVKDGSQLLPGQGGMIDRLDSLSFTAPAFLWWMTLVG